MGRSDGPKLDGRLPKAIVFDLDFTLWDCWCDTHVTPPLKRRGQDINKVYDKHGEPLSFYPDVPDILHKLHHSGVHVAAASRTHAPKVARQILSELLVPGSHRDDAKDPLKAKDGEKVVPAIRLFDSMEIYPGSKMEHFRQLNAKTGIPFEEMLFFDDESRNREVAKLGVTFTLVNGGVSRQLFESGLEASSHPLTVQLTLEYNQQHPAHTNDPPNSPLLEPLPSLDLPPHYIRRLSVRAEPACMATRTATMPRTREYGGRFANGNAAPPARREGVEYSVNYVTNSAGQTEEVLTLADTPEPAAAAASTSRAAPAEASSSAGSSSRARNDPYSGYQQPPAKKRKSDVGAGQAGSDAQGVGYASNYTTVAQNYPYQPPQQQYRNAYQPGPTTGTKRKHDDYDRDNRQKAKQPAPASYADSEGHFIVTVGAVVTDASRRQEYHIERLLGQGTFGKVVSARCKQDNKRYAVKIIRAVHKYQEAAKTEIRVLERLVRADQHNLKKCIPLVAHFDFYGHTCLVTPLLSASVFDFLKENRYEPFPLSHVQKFAKQLLTSIEFVHDNGLVHTDLKPENILLEDTDSVIVPNRRNMNRKILRNTNIQLIDFGSATFDKEYHAQIVSTRHYRAPEIILNMGWSFPCDMWSIGCILVEFITGEALFQTHDNLEHLAMMERVFGQMPSSVAKTGYKSILRTHPDWFKQAPPTGRARTSKEVLLNFPQATTPKQSTKFVRGMRELKDIIKPQDVASQRFLELCTGLLKWDVRDRLNVKQALAHPFFKISDIMDEGNPAYREQQAQAQQARAPAAQR
ncbi:Dual specificity protein kinase lkh1 [Rhodotorula toruloides]|nr:Dual specificity protein kinase lkh1 [Rhodotorula toruloides]